MKEWYNNLRSKEHHEGMVIFTKRERLFLWWLYKIKTLFEKDIEL